MEKIQFSKNFLFGVATSAAQLEGAAQEDGRGLSIWDAFSRIPNTIADNSTPEIACDMYHSYPEDLALAKELNIESFRFSFSWSRIMPEGKGHVNQKGLDYYKRFIDGILHKGIVPNATVYHWDLPYELERIGGWLNRDIVNWYGEFASLLYREFGDSVPLWATFNEPIATYVGYALGVFAPGKKLEKYGRQANHHLLMAHGEGIKRFRQEGLQNSKAGIVVDIWNHHPLRKDSPEDIALAELENEKTYRSYLHPIFNGKYSDELLQYMEQNDCMPKVKPEDMKLINQPLDFFGLNCYNRVLECTDLSLINKEKNQGGNYLDNGKEFYPKAVYEAIQILDKEFKIGIPIYITENGTDNCNEIVQEDGRIHDAQRIEYMEGFLYWIHKAMEEGADIRGYYAWSLLDNWEWCGGFKSRFGLIRTDFDTQKRICKDSGFWYRDLIQNRGFNYLK
jgi:beta-glucosidase